MKPLQLLFSRAGAWWKSRGAGVPPTSSRTSLRPHLSTLVLLLPVLAVLVLANWPGWRVAFVNTANPSSGASLPYFHYRYEHGWPLSYVHRAAYEAISLTGPIQYIANSPWNLWQDILDFHLLALSVDIVTAVGILATAVVLIESRRRRRSSIFQFYLSELLLLVTVVSIGLSFYATRRKEYGEERRISVFLHRNDPANAWTSQATPGTAGPYDLSEGPVWLSPLIGPERNAELFNRIHEASAGGDDLKEVAKLRHVQLLELGDASREQLAVLSQMPCLEEIRFMGEKDKSRCAELPPLPNLRGLGIDPFVYLIGDSPDVTIKGLATLKSLERFYNCDRQFDDRATAQLQGLTHLQSLSLSDCKITSAGTRYLENKPDLTSLSLYKTLVDDRAMSLIGRMKKLERLSLSETRITDGGLEPLKSLKSLNALYLDKTAVTAEGVRRLQGELPHSFIEWSMLSQAAKFHTHGMTATNPEPPPPHPGLLGRLCCHILIILTIDPDSIAEKDERWPTM